MTNQSNSRFKGALGAVRGACLVLLCLAHLSATSQGEGRRHETMASPRVNFRVVIPATLALTSTSTNADRSGTWVAHSNKGRLHLTITPAPQATVLQAVGADPDRMSSSTSPVWIYTWSTP